MSFDPAPCVNARPQRNLQHSRSEHLSGNVLRRRMPGTSGVMMGPNHRAVHTQRPLTDTVHGVITADPQRIEHRPPGAITRPAAVPVVDRLPIPVTGRKITPRRARPSPPHHPVHDQAVIHPPAAPNRRPIRKQRLQNQPIRITQVMTGMHHKCLADPNPHIHGTRPSTTVALRGGGLGCGSGIVGRGVGVVGARMTGAVCGSGRAVRSRSGGSAVAGFRGRRGR